MEFRHPLKIPAVDNGKLNEDDPLIRAIKAKDLETVQCLIETNDGKYKDPTFSMTTIENGNLKIMESTSSMGTILTSFPFHSSPSLQKKTPLLYAVESGNLEIIKLLLKYKPRIQEDPELLITAVSQENVELVELLIHHGANVNAKSQEGLTPLSQAVAVANIEMTKLLISNGADLKNDTESLSLAVAVDSNDIVEILLQNGANPNAQSQGMKFEIFRSVCAALTMLGTGLTARARVAISRPNLCKNKLQKGRTALHLAADLGREEPLRLLLAYGADVDCKTINGMTPLIIAAGRDHGDIVRVLLESDAAMDIADELKRTAFHAAVSRGRWHILDILFDFCFNEPEILLESGIYRQHQVKRTILGNDPQPNKLEKWRICVSIFRIRLFKVHAAEVKVPTNLKPLINAIVVSLSSPEDFDAYTLEIQTLKTQYIGDSDITFFQLLVADLNSLAVLARNDSINSGLELAVKEEKFPFYGSILTSQLRKGVVRRDLMERGIALSPRLVPDFQLPDLVVERVLQYLSNKDINAFIGACSLLK